MIFVLQAGANRHEHICASLELFAQRVMPRFVEGREEREAAKAQRLAEAIGAALTRRPPLLGTPPPTPGPYVIDEAAELDRARRTRRQAPTPVQLRDLAVAQARRTAREQGTRLLARLIDGADDATIERRFGSSPAQRAIFATMTRAFVPDAAAGFQGAIVYELARDATGAEPAVWTIEIAGGQASARPDRAPDAALTVRFQLSDFMRIAAGTLDPARPLMQNRASFEGDFNLAVRLPEMFGAASPY